MANYLSSDLTRARNAFSAYIFRVRLYVIIYKESQSETMLFVTALSKSLLLLRIEFRKIFLFIKEKVLKRKLRTSPFLCVFGGNYMELVLSTCLGTLAKEPQKSRNSKMQKKAKEKNGWLSQGNDTRVYAWPEVLINSVRRGGSTE